MAVDWVGPLTETWKINWWILVLSDHFTSWQYALAIPYATAPGLATTLDECMFLLPGIFKTDPHKPRSTIGTNINEQILSTMGCIQETHQPLSYTGGRYCKTDGGKRNWMSCSHILRTYRGTLHSVTGETANLMMFRRELQGYVPPT